MQSTLCIEKFVAPFNLAHPVDVVPSWNGQLASQFLCFLLSLCDKLQL